MRFIKKGDLGGFIDSLKGDLIGPVRKDQMHIYDNVTSFDEMDLDFTNTTFSPKKYFFPPKEVMFSLKKPEMPKATKKVIFGVRPCDIHAIKVMDMFFGDEFADPYYQSKRKKTMIIGGPHETTILL